MVSGGTGNTASGGDPLTGIGGGLRSAGDLKHGHRRVLAVSGGRNITQDTEFGWSAGSEGDEVVVGNFRSP